MNSYEYSSKTKQLSPCSVTITASDSNGDESIETSYEICINQQLSIYGSNEDENLSPVHASLQSFFNTAPPHTAHEISPSQLLIRHLTNGVSSRKEEENDIDIEKETALKFRLRDFKFAQKKRLERYGSKRPWGILGVYNYLDAIKTDIEWVENAAWRRDNGQHYVRWEDHDDSARTGYNRPYFIYFLMLICSICFIVSIGLNGWKIQPFKENIFLGPSSEVLLNMGARDTERILHNNQWYRLISSVFLNAGILHFSFNLVALLFIGTAIEQSHGFSTTALLFILPALGGNLIGALLLSKFRFVGPSGGIFGLRGACLADITCNWGLLFSKHVNDNVEKRVWHHIKLLLLLLLDIIANVVIGLTPFIDNFTHLSAMVFGFTCGLCTMKRKSTEFFGDERHCIHKLQTLVMRFAGFIFTGACILTAFSALISFKNGDVIRCIGCNYLNCVPFPFWTEEKWWYCDGTSNTTAYETVDFAE